MNLTEQNISVSIYKLCIYTCMYLYIYLLLNDAQEEEDLKLTGRLFRKVAPLYLKLLFRASVQDFQRSNFGEEGEEEEEGRGRGRGGGRREREGRRGRERGKERGREGGKERGRLEREGEREGGREGEGGREEGRKGGRKSQGHYQKVLYFTEIVSMSNQSPVSCNLTFLTQNQFTCSRRRVDNLLILITISWTRLMTADISNTKIILHMKRREWH